MTGPRGFYDSEKTKVAFATGAFDRPAHLPTGPASAGGYQIIGADKAFDLLKAQASGPVEGNLRLTISDLRLGTGTFPTDRGPRPMPAWLFSTGTTAARTAPSCSDAKTSSNVRCATSCSSGNRFTAAISEYAPGAP